MLNHVDNVREEGEHVESIIPYFEVNDITINIFGDSVDEVDDFEDSEDIHQMWNLTMNIVYLMKFLNLSKLKRIIMKLSLVISD